MNKIDLNKTHAMIFYYMQIHSHHNTKAFVHVDRKNLMTV